MSTDLKKNAILILTCIMAVALQIQVTLFSAPEYMGLRVNLGDFLLPFIGGSILFSLLSHRSLWPRWSVRHMYIILIGLVVVMSLSLLQGYWTNGFLSHWALLNKYIGFLILLSYLALGGWVATNECAEDIHTLFIKYFCGFSILVLFLSVVSVFLNSISSISLWIGDYSWDGVMANRNTYMVLIIFVMITMEVYRGHSNYPFPSWVYALFWVMVPFFTLFNASRTGWIVGGGVLFFIFLIKPLRSLKKILPFIFLGGLLLFFFVTMAGLSQLKNMRQFKLFINLIEQEEVHYKGDQKRLIAVEDGLGLYKESNAILGGGLGSYREFQVEKRGEFIDLIDFTALWLLVETGALGLFSFASFFLLCLWIFYQRGFEEDASLFHRSLFFFLIAFACISVLHEIMYTRFLWFIMGLGLVQARVGLRG